MNILVVDDEQSILEIVQAYLNADGHDVYIASTGEKAFETFYNHSIDFIILDIMLPDYTGWEICEKIRESSDVPIILLTAKSNESDVIKGLKLGADDYVTKPFSPKELLARIVTVMRRMKTVNNEDKLTFNKGDLVIFPNTMEVVAHGDNVLLTHTEFELLEIMAREPRHVFSRDQLLEKVKGLEATAMDRVIDSHIKNLRAKIERDPKMPMYIETVHGSGYRFGVNYEENLI